MIISIMLIKDIFMLYAIPIVSATIKNKKP